MKHETRDRHASILARVKKLVFLCSIGTVTVVNSAYASSVLGTYQFTDNSLTITDANPNDGITFSDINIHSYTQDEVFSAGNQRALDDSLDHMDLNGVESPNGTTSAFANGQYLSFTVNNHSGHPIELEKLTGDFTKSNVYLYFQARVFNTDEPDHVVDSTIAKFGPNTGGSGFEQVETLLDGTSPGAGANMVGASQKVSSGESISFYLPFIMNSNSTGRSMAIDNIAIHAKAPRTVNLPIEVVGIPGTEESRTFELTNEQVNTAQKLFFYANGLNIENKGSVKINDGEWVSLNHTDIDIYEKEMHYGGMQHGGFGSIRFTIPSTGLVEGSNTMTFRYDTPNDSGIQIFRFNLIDSDGDFILPDEFFSMEDPTTWVAPEGYDTSEDIAEGQRLWQKGKLYTRPIGSGDDLWYGHVLAGEFEEMRATCSDCHTQNGRDLKFFSSSNDAIITSAVTHLLTEEQGKQIAAYIRSLDVPSHGRPWNPPYQPGPSIKDKSIEYWAAGAGIDAVLENDSEMLSHMFPNGTSQEEIDKFFDISATNDTTIMPVQLQMPSWKQWLPMIHPKDAFGDFYAIRNGDATEDEVGTFSPGYAEEKLNPFIQYPALRTFLEQNDHDAIVANPAAFYEVMGNFWKSFRKFFTKNYGTGGGWRYSDTTEIPYLRTNAEGEVDPGHGQATRASLARMMAVKFFEIHQDFKLEELAARLRPGSKANPRQWLHASGYNVFEVPPHFTAGAWGSTAAYENQPWITGVYETTTWYELQLILNPGFGKSGGTGPVDFNYVPGFINKASGFPGDDRSMRRSEPLRYYRNMGNIYQVKGIVENPDPSKRSGFRMLQMGPNNHLNWNASNYSGTEFAQLMDDYEEGLTAKVINSLVSMMADALEHPQNHPSTYGRSNNPSQFKLHPETKSEFNPDYTKNDYSDVFYRLIPEYLALGAESMRINRIIDWCETAWPLMPWDDIRGLPVTNGTAANEGSDYSVNIADFIDGFETSDIVSANKVSGPDWLIVDPDGTLNGIAPNGAVGKNRFYIEVTDALGVTTIHIVKINVNGVADDVSNIAHSATGGLFLGGEGSEVALSTKTFESLVVDGDYISANNQWVSNDTAWPHWVEIDLEKEQLITNLQFWSGNIVTDFQFQYWNGNAWVDVLTVTGNRNTNYSNAFTAVSTNRVRLYATAGDGNALTLKEVQVYIEEEEEVDAEEGGEGGVEIVLVNVAINKPTFVDSGAGPVALDGEEWNILEATNGYAYIQHRDSGRRLRALDGNLVELAPIGTIGNDVEWELQDIDGLWSYIVSRSLGLKLQVFGEGVQPRLLDASTQGSEVEWRLDEAVGLNNAPEFSNTALSVIDAHEEQIYNANISNMVSDADGDTLNFRKVSGPGWLTIAADGTLGGTPIRDNIGLNSWVVAVEDGKGGSNEATLVLDVIGKLWNVALNKSVSVDSRNKSSQSGSEAVDGKVDDSNKWVSANSAWPHWIEIDLAGEYTIEKLDVWFASNGVAGDFQFQSWDGSQWVDILSETGYASDEYSTYFAPVTTTKVRFYATAAEVNASDDKLRIWEIEVYGKEPSDEIRSSNIALNKLATVDSSYDFSIYPASYAVDGDISNDSSRWVSEGSEWPHWIEIDLAGTYTVDRFKFYSGKKGYNKAPIDFQFQYWDGAAWVDVVVETGNTDPAFSRTFDAVQTDRVRLYATAGEDEFFRLYELEVYGYAISSTNIALNKSVTTDSSLKSSYSGENAVDGDISSNSSRWVSAEKAWPYWIEIDLGGNHAVDGLKFYTGKNGYNKAPADFQFQRWDGSQWVDIIVETGNTNPQYSSTFAPVVTERVRLYATAGSDDYLRLYEIEVFGSSL